MVQFKNELSKFYSKYAIYINPVLKLFLAIFLLSFINLKMGYMDRINSAMIVVMAALFCSFMPLAFMSILAGLFVMLHFYALGLEIAIVAAVVLFLMYILYFRFAAGESLAVLLMPLFFAMKIPYVVPLAMGLLGTPFSIVAVGFGVVLSYLVEYAGANEEMLSELTNENMVTKLRTIVDNIIGNKSMICMVICFSVVVVLVYIIKRMSFPHSWKVAIAAGAVTNIILMTVCLLGLRLDYSMIGILFGSIISGALCLIVEFFAHGLDYRRTENLQFEDDEYYYYVKAVPKFGTGVKRHSQPSANRAATGSRTVRTSNGVKHTM